MTENDPSKISREDADAIQKVVEEYIQTDEGKAMVQEAFDKAIKRLEMLKAEERMWSPNGKICQGELLI